MGDKGNAKDFPVGIDATKLQPSSLQVFLFDESLFLAVKMADLNALKRTKHSTKKTPFQKHKEEKERKKKQAEEEAAAYLGEFEASFGEKKTSQTFVRSGKIVQTNNQQVVVETKREEYKMDGLNKVNPNKAVRGSVNHS